MSGLSRSARMQARDSEEGIYQALYCLGVKEVQGLLEQW
jgi:hypothetical protein